MRLRLLQWFGCSETGCIDSLQKERNMLRHQVIQKDQQLAQLKEDLEDETERRKLVEALLAESQETLDYVNKLIEDASTASREQYGRLAAHHEGRGAPSEPMLACENQERGH